MSAKFSTEKPIQRLTEDQKKQIHEEIGKYNTLGTIFTGFKDFNDMSNNIVSLTQQARDYAVAETGDAFDRNTVNRNFKDLGRYAEQFKKVAQDVCTQIQELEALYEDMGGILNRYFDIKDAPVPSAPPRTPPIPPRATSVPSPLQEQLAVRGGKNELISYVSKNKIHWNFLNILKENKKTNWATWAIDGWDSSGSKYSATIDASTHSPADLHDSVAYNVKKLF